MTVETTQTAPRAGRREWIGLLVLALPTLLVSIDGFSLLLALPTLTGELGASSTQQLWIVDIYGFVIAGLLVTMGTLGDRIGRRKLLLIGGAAFAAASVLAAYSSSAEMLIVARALLGVAGASLSPSTLALISNMFKDPAERTKAISLWLVSFMAGSVVGPLVGGALLTTFWWGSVFLIGVPVMVLLLILGPIYLPEHKDPNARRMDLASVGLSLGAILPFVYGIKELARNGWAVTPLVALVVGLAVGTAFIRRQGTLEHPMVDTKLFTNRAFNAAIVNMLVGVMLIGAMLLFITQYLQLVKGLSPLVAGLWMLPMVVASVIASTLTPKLAAKYRPAYVIAAGLVVAVAGLLLFTQAGATGGLPALVTGFFLINLGGTPLVALSTGLIVGSAPPERAGAAASLSETCTQFGSSLGVAVLGTIATAIYRGQMADSVPAGLPADAAAAAGDTLGGATAVAAGLSDGAAAALLGPAREAFATGMHLASGISAVALIALAVFGVFMLRQIPAFGAMMGGGGADVPAETPTVDAPAVDAPAVEPPAIRERDAA